jgi:hypothetical protein
MNIASANSTKNQANSSLKQYYLASHTLLELRAQKINTRQINDLSARRATKNENGVEEGPDAPAPGQA